MVGGLLCCQTKNSRHFWNWNQRLAIVVNRFRRLTRFFCNAQTENTCGFCASLGKSLIMSVSTRLLIAVMTFFAVLVRELYTAPEGYEDEFGFHFISRGTRRYSSAIRIASPVRTTP